MMWEPLTDEELGEVPNLHISSFGIRGYEPTEGISRELHQIEGMQTCLSVAGEPWWDTFGISKLEFYRFATAAVKEEGLWQCSFNDEYGHWPKW